MSSFRIEFLPSAAKDYHRQDPPLQARIVKALDALSLDPMSGKPLQGPYHRLRSYRIGEYRLVYKADPNSRTILIHRIGHRSDVYR